MKLKGSTIDKLPQRNFLERKRWEYRFCVNRRQKQKSELEGVFLGDFKAARERMRYNDAPSAEKVFKELLQELVYKNHGDTV